MVVMVTASISLPYVSVFVRPAATPSSCPSVPKTLTLPWWLSHDQRSEDDDPARRRRKCFRCYGQGRIDAKKILYRRRPASRRIYIRAATVRLRKREEKKSEKGGITGMRDEEIASTSGNRLCRFAKRNSPLMNLSAESRIIIFILD